MHRFLFVLLFLGISFFGQAQEFSENNTANFKMQENSSPSIDASWINRNYFHNYQFGAFQQSQILTIPEAVFNEPLPNQQEKINILAIGQRAKAVETKGTYSMKLPSNEFQNPNTSIQIYGNQGFSRRTNDDFNFNGKTPDGGIRNEVYKDIRQPFINPYYNLYNRYPRSNDGRAHFYITR